MKKVISKEELIQDLKGIGIEAGDVVLIRANLAAVGRISGSVEVFIDALLEVVGKEGTIVSSAFTTSSFLKKPKVEDAFNEKKKSYAGALPNAMILRTEAFRSRHPMCSYVAIGKYAEEITANHDETSPAYEPIRKIIEMNGKNFLVGCVESSPGFTTTHLAESDLGMLKKLPIFSRFNTVYYEKPDGSHSLYRRVDPGLCSNSFYKFYSLYVKKGILQTGYIGQAYSIIASSKSAYDIDYEQLSRDRRFNICDSKECFTCNANRWDRLIYMPFFFLRMAWMRIKLKYL